MDLRQEQTDIDSVDVARGSSMRKKIIFVSCVFVLGVGFYFFARGAVGGVFRSATAIVSETFKNVLGQNSHKEKVFEIDLASSTGNSQKLGNQPAAAQEVVGAAQAFVLREKEKAPLEMKSKKVHQDVPDGKNSDSIAAASSSTSGSLGVLVPQLAPQEASGATPDCSFTSTATPTHQMILNEIAWMGSVARSGETATAASGREWMEFKNTSGKEIDLSGWQILDDSEKFNINFDKGKIPNSGFYLLERKNDDAVPGVAANAVYSGALSNGGMWLRLFDAACAVVDEINATGGSTSPALSGIEGLTTGGWPGGDNTSKKTLERSVYDLSWYTSADPGGTPRRENSRPVQIAFVDPTAKYTLSVSLEGDGSGEVRSAPAGIVCGVDCLESFAVGASVTLTATSLPNSSFLGWSGACSGTSACKLTVTSTVSVAAGFKSLVPAPSYSNGPPLASFTPPPESSSVQATSSEHLLISEIFYDAAGSDDGKEFIELYNPASVDADLKGWSLRNGTSSLVTIGSKSGDKTAIKSKQYFLVGLSSYTGSPGADVVRSAPLSNTSAMIVLVDASGTTVDSVGYNNSVSPGQSYERSPLDGNAFVAQSSPSPQNSGM